MYRRAPPSYLRHCHCLHYDWLNHTTWSHRNCWTHCTETLELVNTQLLPRSMEFETILLHFLHNTDASMMIANICTYISLYIRNMAIYINKLSLYFPTSTCEHLWPSPSHLVNCAIREHKPSKDAADWSVVADLKRLLNFFFFENLNQTN